jgi:cbb3-type cytochrome oxidase subunit 3
MSVINSPQAAAPQSPLAQLNDVIVTTEVSAWPPAPIWYISILVICVMLIWSFLYLKKRKKHYAAKRQAIILAKNQSDINQLHIILKRLAKHYYGEKVAALSGEKWAEFVSKNCKVTCKAQQLTLLYKTTISTQQKQELTDLFLNAITGINIKGKTHV